MFDNELAIIQRYEAWGYFCSWTFQGREPSLPAARSLVFAHLRRCANLFEIPFHRLAWAIRRERGEKFGRMHYHGLIGGPVKVSRSHCFILNDTWEKLHTLCGMSRHRVFDHRMNGADYIAKCLSLGGDFGANHYEMSKFAKADELTLSVSLLNAVGCRGTSAIDSQPPSTPESKNRMMRILKASLEAYQTGCSPGKRGGANLDGGVVCVSPLRSATVWARGRDVQVHINA